MDCPDKTHVAQFARGSLSGDVVSRLEAHLDECDACLALVAEQARASTENSLPGSSVNAAAESALIHLVAAFARRSDRPAEWGLPVARERYGPYRVTGTLGRGAMGIVYRAIRDDTGERAAVKTVAGASQKVFAAMRREIAFLSGHRHPGVIRILESGIVEGDPWYAMDLLDGVTLDAFNDVLWVSRAGRWKAGATNVDRGSTATRPVAGGGRLHDVLSLFAQLCEPVGFVHRAGAVHCDLKPANIFVRADGSPVLMDFGLLSHAGGAIGRESLEVGGRLRGTLPYISPELIRGNIPDARADLYALGCMLYESLTGRPPFLATTANGFVEAHLRTEPSRASDLVSATPPGLDELLASLLAKRPEHRIGDADTVAERLAQMTRGRKPSGSSVPSAPYLFRPRVVGRDAILEQIQSYRVDAELGKGRLVLIGGESGIGKTFVASEIAQRAARAGFEVITGECTPIAAAGGANPELVGGALEPLRKLLQFASDRCRELGSDAATRLFGSELSIRLLARYEPTLLSLIELPATEDLAALPPMAERERILQAVSELVVRLSELAPTMLVIDDLQWADDLSLAFLQSLTQGALVNAHLLVLAFYRSEEASTAIGDLASRGDVVTLRLARLDAPSLRVMVGDLLSNAAPARFVQALARHSEGNPFFVAEYLRAAAAEGLLDRTVEGWALSPRAQNAPYDSELLALPDSLQSLLERRLVVLAAPTQRLAESAAVLGREFRISMMTAVASSSYDAASRAIDEMLEREIVQRVSTDTLRFRHDKLREAAYARLTAERRSILHGRAARAIQEAQGEDPERAGHYAELAYHLRGAGDMSRAVDYFEKAGEHALRDSSNADAVRFFGEAMQLSGSECSEVAASRLAAWERQTGDALYGLGDLESSKHHLEKAVALLGWPMPATAPRIASYIFPKIAQQIVHRALPRRWITADPQQSPHLLDAARAYDRLEQIYYYRGEYLPLFLANLTTLNLAEQAAPSAHLAAAYTNAGAAAGLMPLRQTAAKYFALAEATLNQAYNAETESYLRLLHAVYLTGLGEWDRAIVESSRALTLATELGFRRRWEEAAGVRGGATCDFDERLAWARQVVESALRRDDPQTLTWGLLSEAEVQSTRGDFAAATEAVAHAESMMPRLGAPEQVQVVGMRGFLAMVQGRIEEAAASADRASALVKKTQPIHVGSIDAYTRIAHVHLAVWTDASGRRARERHAKARAACSDLAKAARLFPTAVPSYCLHEGTRLSLRGNRRRAIELWRRGLAEARRLGLLYREAQLHRALHSSGAPGASPLEQPLPRYLDLAKRLRIPVDSPMIVAAPVHSAQ
ncbi:MAG: AAA family ATPase [Myxococcota bacterium]|nr:AAA family ATPase [Myxococcota bacterium]